MESSQKEIREIERFIVPIDQFRSVFEWVKTLLVNVQRY